MPVSGFEFAVKARGASEIGIEVLICTLFNLTYISILRQGYRVLQVSSSPVFGKKEYWCLVYILSISHHIHC